MKLTVATPLAIVVETAGVVHLRAEDESGSFGILPGHADLITALPVSVASWSDERGVESHVALRGGMLEVTGGDTLAIASREAIASEDLHRLESEVLESFRRSLEEERAARIDAERLYLAAVRRICRVLRSRPERGRGARTAEGFES